MITRIKPRKLSEYGNPAKYINVNALYQLDDKILMYSGFKMDGVYYFYSTKSDESFPVDIGLLTRLDYIDLVGSQRFIHNRNFREVQFMIDNKLDIIYTDKFHSFPCKCINPGDRLYYKDRLWVVLDIYVNWEAIIKNGKNKKRVKIISTMTEYRARLKKLQILCDGI